MATRAGAGGRALTNREVNMSMTVTFAFEVGQHVRDMDSGVVGGITHAGVDRNGRCYIVRSQSQDGKVLDTWCHEAALSEQPLYPTSSAA